MSLLALAVAETEELAPLIMPALAFAGIAVAVFVLLGFVSWSFRDIANRHAQRTGGAGQDSHGAGH